MARPHPVDLNASVPSLTNAALLPALRPPSAIFERAGDTFPISSATTDHLAASIASKVCAACQLREAVRWLYVSSVSTTVLWPSKS